MVPPAVKFLDLVEIVYLIGPSKFSHEYEFLHVAGQLNVKFKHLDSFAFPRFRADFSDELRSISVA